MIDDEDKLPAVYFRAICTAVWGPRYVSAAARALNVQEARIRFWSDDKQDDTPYQVAIGVKQEHEDLFMDRLGTDLGVLDRVNLMADVLEYLDQLIETAGLPHVH
jgi:hypothetical protein